ncbi:MAG: dockerin type I domain-containing protein [Planctomycetota bacterium]
MQIIGINELGAPTPSGGGFLTTAGDLPWLQESDINNNNRGDIRDDTWRATYRDVVIVDRNSNEVTAYNLTVSSLAEPANYAALKQLFINTGQQAPQTNWQQPVEPLDVDADEIIGPLDALQVLQFIPSINSTPIYPNGELPQNRPASDPFLDVNGDGFVSALDALPVIVQLTNRGPITSSAVQAPLSGAVTAGDADTNIVGWQLESSTDVHSEATRTPAIGEADAAGQSRVADQAFAEWQSSDSEVVFSVDHQDEAEERTTEELFQQFNSAW